MCNIQHLEGKRVWGTVSRFPLTTTHCPTIFTKEETAPFEHTKLNYKMPI